MYSQETYDAFATIAQSSININDQYYHILLNGNPIVLGNARIYKTIGSARTAITKTITTIIFQYFTWSKYVNNHPKQANLNLAYPLIKPIYEACAVKVEGNNDSIYSGPTYTNVKKEAKTISEELIKRGIFSIEKI